MPAKPAKPLPVPDETGCYYELIVGTNTNQMKGYEKWAAASFANFVTRVGRRLFFNFKTPADRDSFLAALEKSLIETGTLVNRTYLN